MLELSETPNPLNQENVVVRFVDGPLAHTVEVFRYFEPIITYSLVRAPTELELLQQSPIEVKMGFYVCEGYDDKAQEYVYKLEESK